MVRTGRLFLLLATSILMLQTLTPVYMIYVLCQYGQRCYLCFTLYSQWILLSLHHAFKSITLYFSKRKVHSPVSLLLRIWKTANSLRTYDSGPCLRCLELKWHWQMLGEETWIGASMSSHGCCRSSSLSSSEAYRGPTFRLGSPFLLRWRDLLAWSSISKGDGIFLYSLCILYSVFNSQVHYLKEFYSIVGGRFVPW